MVGSDSSGEAKTFVFAAGSGMICGTVTTIGGIRPARSFTMELVDPRRQRTLRHHYQLEILPEVA